MFSVLSFVIIWLRKTRLQTRMRQDTGEFHSNISAINDNYNMATSYMYLVSILSAMMTIWQTKGTLIILITMLSFNKNIAYQRHTRLHEIFSHDGENEISWEKMTDEVHSRARHLKILFIKSFIYRSIYI